MNAILLFMSVFLFQNTTFAQVNVILDTDIGSDCDDAGTLAVLHKLADEGEINILGVIFSSGINKHGVGVCDAINTYYNRGDLPLGQYHKEDVGDPLNHYNLQVATNTPLYKHDVVDSAMELVQAYKNMLKGQKDRSVTIITVGHPNGLAHLMRDKEGMQFVKQKVDKWVTMAYTGEKPIIDWNFGRNGSGPYVGEVLEEWPHDLIFSGFGEGILTGHKKLPKTSDYNPVKLCYQLWNNAINTGRHSWDQIAVLAAVRPHLFEFQKKGSMVQDKDLKVHWDSNKDNPKHIKVSKIVNEAELTELIEELMALPPKK